MAAVAAKPLEALVAWVSEAVVLETVVAVVVEFVWLSDMLLVVAIELVWVAVSCEDDTSELVED